MHPSIVTKTLPILALLLLTLCLAACSGPLNPPTEAEARAVMERDITNFSQGCIKLVKFRLINEQELGNILMVKAEAEIEFLADCNWPIETLVLVTKPLPGAVPTMKKGDRRMMNVTLQFSRSEQGWIPTELKKTR